MAVVEIPADTEPPPQTDTFVDTAFYIKLKATFEVIFVLVWGGFIQQYHFSELDDRMSNLKRVKLSPNKRRKQPWSYMEKC